MPHFSPYRLAAAALIFAGATSDVLGAEPPVPIRVATLAPDGSSSMKILAKGATELEIKIEKRVVIKYYAGGVQGDERDVVRKINLGQLDGAVLTSVGLSMVEESIRVLELPRMFATAEELDYVADRMWPYFQKKFESKGFRLQDRDDVGWIYFVSKDEIKSLDTLKSLKVWLWGDDAIMRALYKELGVSGVPLVVPEVAPALTIGRINAAYGSPLSAVALQWNTKVKFLCTLPVSFSIGGTVVKLDAVKKLSPSDQELMANISRGISATLRRQVRKDNDSAKKEMERKGVKITEASADLIAGFDKAAALVWKQLTGKVFSKEELAMVIKYRDEYRAKNPAP